MTGNPVFIDSHAHLVHEDFGEELPDVLARARSAGVERFVVPGTDVRSSEASLSLARDEKGVYAAVGIHPHDVSKAESGDLDRIRELCSGEGTVAVGEIGLDYYYDFSPPELQKEYFAGQLEIASDAGLPVIVHTRESMDDAVAIVREHVMRRPDWCSDDSGAHRGVFHCFTGTADQARELFGLGFYVSFPGILTFKRSPVAELFAEIGMERVLLETDAPYMAPVPLRGKRNEPSYMLHTAVKMSELSGRPIEEVAATTRRNTLTLFKRMNDG